MKPGFDKRSCPAERFPVTMLHRQGFEHSGPSHLRMLHPELEAMDYHSIFFLRNLVSTRAAAPRNDAQEQYPRGRRCEQGPGDLRILQSKFEAVDSEKQNYEFRNLVSTRAAAQRNDAQDQCSRGRFSSNTALAISKVCTPNFKRWILKT